MNPQKIFKNNKPKNRRGLSSVVGSVFFLIIFTSAASYVIYSMNQLDNFGLAVIGKAQETIDRSNEAFEITKVTIDSSKFNITVQNTGQLPLNITRLWVQNKTTPTWPISKFSVNQILAPGQNTYNIGQSLPLYARTDQSYDIFLVTDRGNTKDILVNSASKKPLILQLFTVPDRVSIASPSATLLFTVTNNMSDNSILTNLVPKIIVSTPVGATATLVSPVPSNYTILKNGNTAIFKWVYSISGNTGQKINFTASIKNGYLNNYAVGNVTIINPNVGLDLNTTKKTGAYTITNSDDIVAGNTTSGSFTLTLPSAVTATSGKMYYIKNIGTSASNILKVGTTGAQTIDGATNVNMTYTDQTLGVYSDGANWRTFQDLDASFNSYFVKGSTTKWYGNSINQLAATTQISIVSTLRASPWIVDHTIVIDKIQAEIAVAANPTTTTCRIGIYRDNGNAYPQALVTGSTAFADTTAGVKTYTPGSPITLQKGLYWMAYTCGTAATTQPTWRALPAGAVPPILGVGNTMGTNGPNLGYTVAFTYAALPAQFPAGAAVLTATDLPAQILVEIQKG